MALFSRQKKEKRKGQESTIGKIIYSFLLFMPILAVGVACLYVVFNKNAYQSYTQTEQPQIVTITSNKQIVPGQTYYFRPNTTNGGNQVIYHLSNISITLPNPNPGYKTNNISFIYSSGRGAFRYFDDNNNQVGETNWETFNQEFHATVDSIYLRETTNNLNATVETFKDVTQKLDNVFYIQLERLESSTLFNWTKDTGTYTVIHNTTTALGITNTYMPMLLTYWMIVSVIYFIYDIGLMLVWVMHRKIHELQEEI